METPVSFRFPRRHLWKVGAIALPLSKLAHAAAPVPEPFPSHPLQLAREVVGVSHSNLKRVKELVDARPALARASVDWGFGDWEDALGAASHVGNRDIAEYLIAKGARPTLFSAAMLGQLDTVKAFVATQPGAQRIPGPHSISLLAHAKAGGKAAEAVHEYLRSLGDAGAPEYPLLTAEDVVALTGIYTFGPGPTDRIEIAHKAPNLTFNRQGTSSNRLIHLGDRTFHPAGANAVRIRFTGSGPNSTLSVFDPELILTGNRV